MNKEVCLSNSIFTKIHDNVGGVKGTIIFKNSFTVEEYQSLVRNNSFILCNKNYITNLQTIEQQYSAILSENAELQNKYNKALETLDEYSMPCEIDKFMDENSDYCETHCGVDKEQFKKCWDKFIEWKLKDE